jgi:hypothetical protein
MAMGRARITPTLRVSAAPAPASPATHHRRRRAPQNASRARRRNSDSLYGARKKSAAGNTAAYTTALRARSSSSSDRPRRYRTISAPRNAAFETSSEAARGCPPSGKARTRMTIGYSGKKAALPSSVR